MVIKLLLIGSILFWAPYWTFAQVISKIDSLQKELSLRESEKERLDDEIEDLNRQIQIFSKNSDRADGKIQAQCAKNCYLMSKPSIDGDVIIKIPDGVYVLLSPDYYNNEYVKATYASHEGYLYSVTLTQTPEIKSIYKRSSGSTAQSLYNSDNKSNSNKDSSKPRPATRTYYQGPRGGCYYISSAGTKVYVDRSLCK